MPIDLSQVLALANDVAREEGDALRVVAATSTEGGRSYAEVVFAASAESPSRLVVGLSREQSPGDVREKLRQRIRAHLTSF